MTESVVAVLIALGRLFSIKSSESIRPGQSDECTSLEYPIGVYYDFYYEKWFYKDWHKKFLLKIASWIISKNRLKLSRSIRVTQFSPDLVDGSFW